ncbi:MAG: GNAT family N-acetyltransferase [Promethearchaeia archaeon]
MNFKDNQIISLTEEQVNAAAEVAVEAFLNYPISIYLFPDIQERRDKLVYGFRFVLKYGVRHGIVHATSSNLEGVAVWLPPKNTIISPWDAIRCGGLYTAIKTGLRALRREKTIYDYIYSTHKRLAPFDHWYLKLIAINPTYQGNGYGSKLLNIMIQRSEKENLPIYLETNMQGNVSYYKKHGFKVLEYAIIPDTDIPNWCMLREV